MTLWKHGFAQNTIEDLGEKIIADRASREVMLILVRPNKRKYVPNFGLIW
jgi:hypothetical protein